MPDALPNPAPPAKPRFVWPPSRSRPSAPTPSQVEAEFSPDLLQPPPGEPATRWQRIERAWLDVRLESWPARRDCAGWRPWDEGDYCTFCGQSVGPGEADGDGCAQCRDQRRLWRRLVCLGPYRPPLDQAIRDVKFHGMRRIGMQLGEALGQRIRHVMATLGLAHRPALLVPVPTSLRRRMSRGIDHGVVIARAAAHACDGRCLSLLRRRHRPRQLEVAASGREKNAAGSMYPRRGWLSDPWQALRARHADAPPLVILVDDVITTGATLRAASRTLIRGCRSRSVPLPEVWTAVLAATPAWQTDPDVGTR